MNSEMSEKAIQQLAPKAKIMKKIDNPTSPKRLLNIYFTAGYPHLDATTDILLNLQAAGADMVEVGLPYSDPLADGPTIQESGTVALKNGMTTGLLFEQLKSIRNRVNIPVYLMAYYNQWLQFGLEDFCDQCSQCGISGLIIPDLPIAYFDETHRAILERYHLDFTFLVTPTTDDDRMKLVDELTTGFVYVVSKSATTGKEEDISADQKVYFNRIKTFSFSNKTLIGFGIHDAATFDTACNYADGAIVGSAFIRHIKNNYDLQHITSFIQRIKKGTS